jgi:hypothetical protein
MAITMPNMPKIRITGLAAKVPHELGGNWEKINHFEVHMGLQSIEGMKLVLITSSGFGCDGPHDPVSTTSPYTCQGWTAAETELFR